MAKKSKSKPELSTIDNGDANDEQMYIRDKYGEYYMYHSNVWYRI